MSQKALAHSIARVAAEVLHAHAQVTGQLGTALWEELPKESQERMLLDAEMHLADNTLSIAASHLAWVAERRAAGWTYGKVFLQEAKEDPKMVPYVDLPEVCRTRDFLFRGVVHAIAREQLR